MLRITLDKKSTTTSRNILSTTTSSSKIVACFICYDFLFKNKYDYLIN